MNPELKAGERIDDLQTGGYRLIQNPGRFCFGTDAVLVADFAAPRRNERAADLGSGNGIIAVLMAAHQPCMRIDAVELQPDMADMAARSVVMNGLEDRIRVHCGDMRQAYQALGRGVYSLAVCNPPYRRAQSGPVSDDDALRIARHEGSLTPEDIAGAANKLLKFGGRFCVVYPAQRAFEMMLAMQRCLLTPKRIRSVHAHADRKPKLALIEAVKGAKQGLDWLEPLILYDNDGQMSAELKRIYRIDS